VSADAPFVKEFAEFLDHFYDRTTDLQMVACLEDEPVEMTDMRLNALFAAAADYLSRRYRLRAPGWVYNKKRYLELPWFTPADESMREYLTFSSPAEFRSRNIYTEAAPLRRARTWQAEQRLAQRLETTREPGVEAAKPAV
jgi:hypothetical protein